MYLSKLLYLLICTLILSSFLSVSIVTAEDTIENLVTAEFYIVFETGTHLTIEIILDAQKLTTDKTYNAEGIKNANERELGAFSFLLYQMLDRQLNEIFKNAEILNFTMPTFDGERFNEELKVNFTNSFFGLNESVNTYNFINGVLDMGALVNYSLNLHAEPGWNNTYFIGLEKNLAFKRTTGAIEGDNRKWMLKNWNGKNSEKLADMQLKMENPTTPTMSSEDIFLEFVLDSKVPERTSLTNNILVKAADIRVYNILPSFIYNLDYIPADGIRLLVDNGFIVWNEFYKTTISPKKEKIIPLIEQSSFNQTLDMTFSWDSNTTVDCSTPYKISKMDNKPAIKAIFTDDRVDLKICDISSRALFGLINSDAILNISEKDVNFGDNLNKMEYDYNVILYLPDNIYLDGENVYTWNESNTLSGEFESDVAPSYNTEEKDTIIEIEVKTTDLNLLSLFTGRTDLTFGLDLKEIKNYNITKLPDEFTLPEKVTLMYLNADAFRLCIEENVFSEERITAFLNNEKELFENILRQTLPGLKITGNVDRNVFEGSLIVWDGDISKMDGDTPVKTSSYAHSSYQIPFDFSFLPPGIDIPQKKFNFSGFPNQNVTYKVIFPQGIFIDFNDPLNKTIKDKTIDGRYYLETTFSASESNLSLEVSYKMIPSALFIIGVFVPCIVSFIIAIILIIIIYLTRKKRKKGRIETHIEKDDFTGYEDEEFYVPPPPGSK